MPRKRTLGSRSKTQRYVLPGVVTDEVLALMAQHPKSRADMEKNLAGLRDLRPRHEAAMIKSLEYMDARIAALEAALKETPA